MHQEHTSYFEISRTRLIHNIKEFKKRLPQQTHIIAVVKANAYGHGLEEVVTSVDSLVYGFQVDDIEEFRRICSITQKPIYIFGFLSYDAMKEVLKSDGVLGCFSFDYLKQIEGIAQSLQKKVKIHLKIDALLGRQGILMPDVYRVIDFLKTSQYIYIESVYSHFSNIEDVSNLLHAQKQYTYLLAVKKVFFDSGFTMITHHISATGGILTSTTNWGGVFARLGIGMYGLWPSKKLYIKLKNDFKLKPVLKWVSTLSQVKEIPSGFPVGYGMTYKTKRKTVMAIVPQGYSDGYDRSLSNIGRVIVRGQKCRVIGRVAMNMFAINVTSIKNVKCGDRVVLLGTQKTTSITAEEIADHIGTINYEVVARLSPLVPRVITK